MSVSPILDFRAKVSRWLLENPSLFSNAFRIYLAILLPVILVVTCTTPKLLKKNRNGLNEIADDQYLLSDVSASWNVLQNSSNTGFHIDGGKYLPQQRAIFWNSDNLESKYEQ